MNQRTSCPRCGESIRLTREELADKRGFCTLCDARFDLRYEMMVGVGPLRLLPFVQAVELAAPSIRSNRRMMEITAPGRPTRYMIRPVPWLSNAMLPANQHWGTALLAGGLFGKAAFFPTAALLLLSLLFSLFGREEVVLDGEHLTLCRGIRWLSRKTRVPFQSIEGFSVISRVGVPSLRSERLRSPGALIQVLRAGQEPLQIGAGLDHDENAMQWLSDRLEHAVHIARIRDRAPVRERHVMEAVASVGAGSGDLALDVPLTQVSMKFDKEASP
jgi:hypothetical protein